MYAPQICTRIDVIGDKSSQMECKMTDILRMDYINSLPQPFIVTLSGNQLWPVNDFCADAGILRIDVCGKLQTIDFCDVRSIEDGDGNTHDPETFYSDYVDTIQTH